jgi:hypothetical protein
LKPWRERSRTYRTTSSCGRTVFFVGAKRAKRGFSAAHHEIWETAFDAFRMEQSLLRHFDTVRHPQNREIVSPVEVHPPIAHIGVI